MASDDNPGQMYDELRKRLLNLDPNAIGLTRENFPHPVFTLVMETGYAEGVFSLSSIADGTTSLYFSTGGGIIGAGAHEEVHKASSFLLSGAQHHHSRAEKVAIFPEPSPGEVIFYFITFDGVRYYAALEEDLGSGKDELSDLFFAAHNVITALRKSEENHS